MSAKSILSVLIGAIAAATFTAGCETAGKQRAESPKGAAEPTDTASYQTPASSDTDTFPTSRKKPAVTKKKAPKAYALTPAQKKQIKARKNLEWKKLDKKSRDLQTAAFRNEPERAEALIKAGAKVDGRSPKGETPLSIAAFRGNSRLVRLLLKHGASLNDIDHNGQTALMKACAAEREEAVRLLLRHRAHVNPQDRMGTTALMFAALGRSEEIVRSLLKAGAKVNLRNKEGKTALSMAEGFENKRVVDMLSAVGGTR
ncbi:MAG: ankyrin repeat domain-containing protein [Nitrospinota bacterium]|nr:ankyrin repeat domain-containing protein [Nitrospinota bacterium]